MVSAIEILREVIVKCVLYTQLMYPESGTLFTDVWVERILPTLVEKHLLGVLRKIITNFISLNELSVIYERFVKTSDKAVLAIGDCLAASQVFREQFASNPLLENFRAHYYNLRKYFCLNLKLTTIKIIKK